MAAKWKEPPRDALDTLTLNAVDMKSMDEVEQLEFMPFDPIVKRTEGTVREVATGKTFKTTKGVSILFFLSNEFSFSAVCVKRTSCFTTLMIVRVQAPHVLLKLVKESNPGLSSQVIDAVENDVHKLGLRGVRSLAVAKTNDSGVWEMLGLLTFLDPPRPDTKKTIEDANYYGVAVKVFSTREFSPSSTLFPSGVLSLCVSFNSLRLVLTTPHIPPDDHW